ncbi:tetratricopeptide repeat protein [Aspergillus novofumigatus IBT 16806]|uniref:Tetratricopeptide repeat domain protein n=1 Tax=Aspergillus novofumigatus (strain IBT 16806) TaxID=1392255 RepID=A0A2I1BUW3_ASPN1|nr:tetratricopeptide repeat domain protein [Aspergillus novofumigatus IBT 16806]PKX89156.1 tetratricopeptide repeat domain protein [Aspergillus novofumigatus IBT 16806]
MTHDSDVMPSVPASDEYYDLGSFGRKITTSSPDTQTWFNRGLSWVYAFNHVEGAYCFEQAIANDPSCAIAYWGLAYAVGPNYNKPWDRFDREDLKNCMKRAYEASRKAKEHANNANPIEQGLIEAIQSRFQSASPPILRSTFGDDLDVAALYADALMNQTPWALWDLFTGEPNPKAATMEVKMVLERALTQKGSDKHPGLLHLYIHYIEMSPNPELGINVADQLRDLMPDAGHIHHMPTHLDILIGDWRRSIASNYKATLADDKYVRRAGPYNFYTFYRLHDYHSLIYAAMLSGKLNTALDAVDRMEASVPEDVLQIESPPMADWLENFMSIRLHVMVRFGMWEALKQMELPKDSELYRVTTATTHYAKGVAYAATGDVDGALEQRELFQQTCARVPETRRVYNSKCTQTLAVAAAMLDGEIEYRRQNCDKAFEHLRESIELDDKLPYSEPWSWMQPSRHAYAALLLEQGHIEEAAKVYRADLGLDDTLIRPRRHPNNVWSLQGYHECLTRLGRREEAAVIEPAVKLALAVADIPIKSSCFCRLDTSQAPRVIKSCSSNGNCH